MIPVNLHPNDSMDGAESSRVHLVAVDSSSCDRIWEVQVQVALFDIHVQDVLEVGTIRNDRRSNQHDQHDHADVVEET